MAVKVYRPTSPGRRGKLGLDFSEITKDKPERSLLLPLKKKAGRSNQGRITVRHRGGGSKRRLRIIDFKRNKYDIPGKVFSIEYDPNRTANIALINYADGEKRYILAPVGLKVGQVISSGENAEFKPGNALPLKKIPLGMSIHNIEIYRGKGGQMVRSAGGSAQLVAKESRYALVKLPSGELRKIDSECMATIGQIGNIEYSNISLGKAGVTRHMGWRPQVRGSAMTPRDHPHGGGEGRCPIGLPGPKTPWGKPALGYRTRRNKRTNNFIIRRKK